MPAGMPAITPTRAVDPRVIATPYVTSTAQYTAQVAYTADDVRAYLRAHPLLQRPESDDRVLFMPAGQVETLLGGAPVGRAAPVVVCVVEARAWFVARLTPRQRRAIGHLPPIMRTAWAVFDARSGNRLVEVVRTRIM